MRTLSYAWRARRSNLEAGFSLLYAMFLLATMIILASAAVPNVLIQGRRQLETDMIWRGEQYERAIGLFYRKTGRYPTSMDDLLKGVNGVHFLRKTYKDPMNSPDGTWRLIYVGPNGQLIGSVRRTNLMQLPGGAPNPGLPGGGTFPGFGATQGAPPGGGMTTPGQNPAAPGGAGTLQPGGVGDAAQSPIGGLAPNPLESQPQPLTGPIIGGNIIGVGSTIKKSSLMVYQGGKTYYEWEFIWNPMQQVQIGAPVAQPVNPNAPQNPVTPQPPQPQIPPSPNGSGFPQ